MDHWQYLLVLAACVVITIPIEFLGSGVYRQIGRAAKAILPVAAVFAVWDVLAILAGIWTYNPRYVTGVHLGPLPLEELLFFLVVPLCGLLTFCAVEGVDGALAQAPGALRGPTGAEAMMGYTLPTVIAVVVVIVLEFTVLRTGIFRKPAYWISMVIVVGFQIPVDGWLTKLSAPIVLYDEQHTTGIRFPWDIPIEDFFFGWAMVTAALMLWERQRNRARQDP